jgi:hypothetical protein
MLPIRHYRDLITRASRDGDRQVLLAKQLAEAERAKEILCAKGYGNVGMAASEIASLVPTASAA